MEHEMCIERCKFSNYQWDCRFRGYIDCWRIRSSCRTCDDRAMLTLIRRRTIDEIGTCKYMYKGMIQACVHDIGVRLGYDLTLDQIEGIYDDVLKVYAYYEGTDNGL